MKAFGESSAKGKQKVAIIISVISILMFVAAEIQVVDMNRVLMERNREVVSLRNDLDWYEGQLEVEKAGDPTGPCEVVKLRSGQVVLLFNGKAFPGTGYENRIGECVKPK